MKLNLTYSAYREMEQIPGPPLREIGEAILGLAHDPMPMGASVFEGTGGCHYLTIEGYYILYHIGRSEEGVTVLGVVAEGAQTVH
jgi:hypothetical protein